MPAVLDTVEARAGPARPAPVELVVGAYADMVREHLAIAACWLSGALDAATRRVERATDATIAERLAGLVAAGGGPRPTALQSRTLVALIDGLLRHAFSEHPDGDPQILREACRAARAYVAALEPCGPGSRGAGVR